MVTDEFYGLYVHIPFCISKCTYCDFMSVAKNDILIDEYTKALCTEMKMYKASFSDNIFDTIFIGGGTPSCIPEGNLEKIISSIYKNFNTKIVEFTIEINPGTGNKAMFSMLKDLGVNRASVGLQCANDKILKSIGRIHNVEQFKDTIFKIRDAGIDNFSADIMSGLPQQTSNDLISSINLTHELGAKHISMYTLKLEDGTPLKEAVKNGSITLPTIDEEYQMSLSAREHLESLGYYRYEISNFAKEGWESKHNLKYWNRVPYLGLGVAAASMYNDTRCTNVLSIKDYIDAINQDNYPLSETNHLSKEEIAFEIIMLSTRLSSGMEYKKCNEFLKNDFKIKYAGIINNLAKENLIENSNTHLKLTQKGMDLQNSVLLRFMD